MEGKFRKRIGKRKNLHLGIVQGYKWTICRAGKSEVGKILLGIGWTIEGETWRGT
jgi:hypothetical protein